MECEDFLAVAWQHEMEHLSGHVFIENLSFTKRQKFEKEWKNRKKSKNRFFSYMLFEIILKIITLKKYLIKSKYSKK